jgi:hypothetical protein
VEMAEKKNVEQENIEREMSNRKISKEKCRTGKCRNKNIPRIFLFDVSLSAFFFSALSTKPDLKIRGDVLWE